MPSLALFEFGPFRLDVCTGSLYRGDEFIALTPKALDTLRVLVEQPGQLVTKEELMERVWPDAHVEEGNLANNISMLRKVLNPHFEGDGPIATVNRRGYRFVEPVRVCAQARSAEAATAVAMVAAKVDQSDHTSVVASADRMLLSSRIVAIVATVLVIVGTLAVSLGVGMPALAEADSRPVRRSVAVLPMKNLSGDAAHHWLSTALSETISADLAGGNQFRVVSGENVMRIQREQALPAGVGLTRKQLDEIGRDLAADLVLTGNYLLVHGKIRVDVRLDEVATGEALVSASITDSADRFLDIVSRAGGDLRAKLGLNPATPADAAALQAAFAVSPGALRNYFQGLDALRLRDGPKARDFFVAATTEEQDFALAHSALSTTWRLLGYDARGAASGRRAVELSSRLSLEDRLSVEAQFHEATASWPKAIELYQRLWTLYPDNIEYGLKLGNAQWLGGRSADTLKTIDDLRRMPERDRLDTRIDLLEASAADTLADYPRATALAAKAAEKAVAHNASLLLARARLKQGIYAIRVARRDEALKFFSESEALFAALGETGGVADAVRWQGAALFEMARYDEAAKAGGRALEMATGLSYVRLATEVRINLADAARLGGDLGSAVALAEQALASAREADNRSQEARAMMTIGAAVRLGNDFARARDMYQQSAAISGAIGDVRNQNGAINNSAVIDFLTGDLAAARGKYESILVHDRKSGNRGGIALRLANLSRVLAMQRELAGAETLNAEECRLQEELKSRVNLAWCRTRLAAIWLELGKRGEAEALARQIAIADFGTSVNAPVYIARFARLMVALGDVPAAAQAIEAAERVQAKAGVIDEQAIQLSVIRAEVECAQGKHPASIARLNRARADADRLGLVTWSRDAQHVLSRPHHREQTLRASS